MRVILNEEVKSLGNRGEVRNVSAGFARNFLIPKGLAFEDTPANMARFTATKKKYEEKVLRDKNHAEEAARVLDGYSLTIARRVGEQELLYGSVTAADIAAALAEKGVEVDKRKIEMEPIKRLGSYEVPVHLHHEITPKLKIEVVAE